MVCLGLCKRFGLKDAQQIDVETAVHAIMYNEDYNWIKGQLMTHCGLLFSQAHGYNQFWVTLALSTLWFIFFVPLWYKAKRVKYKALLFWESFFKPTVEYFTQAYTTKLLRGVFCGTDLSHLPAIRQPDAICPAMGERYWTLANIVGTSVAGAITLFAAWLVLVRWRIKEQVVVKPLLRYRDKLPKVTVRSDEQGGNVPEEAESTGSPAKESEKRGSPAKEVEDVEQNHGHRVHRKTPQQEVDEALDQAERYFKCPGWVPALVFLVGWLWSTLAVLQHVFRDAAPVEALYYVLGGVGIVLCLGALVLEQRDHLFRLACSRIVYSQLQVFALNTSATFILREGFCRYLHHPTTIGSPDSDLAPPSCHRNSGIDLAISILALLVSSAALAYDWYANRHKDKAMWKALRNYCKRDLEEPRKDPVHGHFIDLILERLFGSRRA